ncbi:MAG: hypothetical protein K2M68_01785 [Muribaculaceae bacterium]|nr:hypothetical protein [Muribaculaceae bacterium]
MKNYSYIWDAINTQIDNANRQIHENDLNYFYAKEAEKRAKRERRSQFWNNLAGAMLDGLAAGVNAYTAAQYYGSIPKMNTVVTPQGGHSGLLADAMSQPGYFQSEQQKLLQLSMNQVQWAEMQEYNQAREAYQRMGRDLTLNEYRALKGQAIMEMKEQGYDIIAEQNAINKEMHDFNRSQMNSGKENVARISQQNEMKYGNSSSATIANSSSSTSATVTAKSSSSSSPTITSSRSNVGSSSNSSSPTLPTTVSSNNNAHEQYKSGNINANSKDYGDKIKNVSMAVKDGASYRNVSLHGELYKKGSQYFVKIHNSFFSVNNTGGAYNSYIIYGSTAHYFNR